MFKSIKEFFVGKPKVEETPAPYKIEVAESPTVVVTEPAVLEPAITGAAAQPVTEVISPDTVTISVSDNMNVSIGQPDTITLTPPVDPGAWPFPNTPPIETVVKKKRTFVKREEPAVTTKKPTPAIKVSKNKPRKKK